ncbi:NEP1-interacting protein-like 2 isoform X2 [Macadamia integrifolia]|uniref:NEP1-interacting protein-like 2 isoform X2 n=1 Tax=Macadamia integrifolia TaxID=60698 RepID=UPI001C5299C1|nr:NEP1-interacting protein-like 2 isoform X2 [Macadamia integrifolia]
MDSFIMGRRGRIQSPFYAPFVMATHVSYALALALAGFLVGSIRGAVTSLTTETRFWTGVINGAISGVKAGLDLSISVLVQSPTMMNSRERSDTETFHIYDVDSFNGLSPNMINRLPSFNFSSSEIMAPSDDICCTICLQDLTEGDIARKLPNCRHLFHLQCIDKWLVGQGSCPLCRQEVWLTEETFDA